MFLSEISVQLTEPLNLNNFFKLFNFKVFFKLELFLIFNKIKVKSTEITIK